MKSKWPTLEGRLSQPLTTRKEALLQLQKTMPLSEYAQKELNKLTKNDFLKMVDEEFGREIALICKKHLGENPDLDRIDLLNRFIDGPPISQAIGDGSIKYGVKFIT